MVNIDKWYSISTGLASLNTISAKSNYITLNKIDKLNPIT